MIAGPPSITGVDGDGLGEYLAARRGLVDPATTGLVLGGGRRRVAGLRREEVAVLAGVSVDYYRRLEQGRERRPSAGVLDALSRVLGLDEAARAHLYRVAGAPVVEVRAPEPLASVPLRGLLDAWLDQPAFVLGPALDVLAANALAAALFEGFDPADNIARMIFLDPHGETFFLDLDRVRLSCVASLRRAGGTAPQDPRVDEVVGSLLAASPAFAALWARHDSWGKTVETNRLHHPVVGALRLTAQVFDVRGAPGQELVVFSAAPDSASARSLALLGSPLAPAGGGQQNGSFRAGSLPR